MALLIEIKAVTRARVEPIKIAGVPWIECSGNRGARIDRGCGCNIRQTEGIAASLVVHTVNQKDVIPRHKAEERIVATTAGGIRTLETAGAHLQATRAEQAPTQI